MLIERWGFPYLIQQFADISGKNTANNGILRNRVSERKVILIRNALGTLNQIFFMNQLCRIRPILQNHSLKHLFLLNLLIFIAIIRVLVLLFGSHAYGQ